MEHEEWLELADIYALNALDGDELARVAAHLSSGCALCKAKISEVVDLFSRLPSSLEPIVPPGSIRTRVFEAIAKETPYYQFVHAAEGAWREIGPGLTTKVLHMDSSRHRVTALLRMEAGSRYENHRHTQTEELYVLEGSCYCGGRLLRKGDYHRAEVGSIHLDTRTDEGSLMLIMTSMQNETLA